MSKIDNFKGKRGVKGFKQNPQNINKTGQNRKSISSVNKGLIDKGYEAATKTDIVNCFNILINLSLPELKEMINDDKQPALIRVVGKAIMSGKGFDVIEKILDRGIGKAGNSLDLTTNGESMNTTITFVGLDDDE